MESKEGISVEIIVIVLLFPGLKEAVVERVEDPEVRVRVSVSELEVMYTVCEEVAAEENVNSRL